MYLAQHAGPSSQFLQNLFKSSDVALDKGCPTWERRVLAQCIRTTTGLQQVQQAVGVAALNGVAVTDAPVTRHIERLKAADSAPLPAAIG